MIRKEENKALLIEEPLIFEQSEEGCTAVDWPEETLDINYLGQEERKKIELPGLSEPQVVRHYTRLSQKNYGIDTGFFPLGSCTMKHNPRLNEKVARFFSSLHPFQPESTVQGILQVYYELSQWLIKLTGLNAVALTPAAGAHGELCGLMVIKAAIDHKKENHRRCVLVPESAHGTNPATAVACGFGVKTISCNALGLVDLDHLRACLDETIAAVMITNPNTCGLFEKDILVIAEEIHKVGAYFYCDGANFNAFVGKVRPGDLGVDCMHINLHKTFSTPHGGGGPGGGPVVFSKALSPYIPIPYVVLKEGEFSLVEDSPLSIGRLKAFHGQSGVFARALSYIMSHGKDGLKQVAEDAVLNANYLWAKLKEKGSFPFPGPFMHEILMDDQFLKKHSVTTLDFAKALIDKGYHPMTMYFPLIVSGALLVEPTESETKGTLDAFVEAFSDLVEKIEKGETNILLNAPLYAPRKRLDEVKAARNPILRYTPRKDT